MIKKYIKYILLILFAILFLICKLNKCITNIEKFTEKKLRVLYINEWKNKNDFFLTELLKNKYDVEFVSKDKKPNVVVAFYLDTDNFYCGKNDVVFFQIIGENIRPNEIMKKADLTVAMEHIDYKKYLRFPLWYIERIYPIQKNIKDLKKSLQPYEINFNSLDFDRFLNELNNRNVKNIINNISHKIYTFGLCASHKGWASDFNRETISAKLNKYKKVYSPCKFLNNMETLKSNGLHEGVLQKFEFYEKCKFVITYENSRYPGYETEKIFDVFMGRAVPIYFGSKMISNDFNKEAFINRHDFNSDEEMIEHIKYLDNNDEEYIKMLNKQIFTDNIFSRINMNLLTSKIYNTIDNKLF